jgi:uncharacterized membrane protein
MNHNTRKARDFPIAAGLLFGLGLGGFFDGILLHQVLQWHHMLTSAGYPADSVQNLGVLPVAALDIAPIIRYTRYPHRIRI